MRGLLVLTLLLDDFGALGGSRDGGPVEHPTTDGEAPLVASSAGRRCTVSHMLGCFDDSHEKNGGHYHAQHMCYTSKDPAGTDNTIQNCMDCCAEKNFSYAGVENAERCGCSTNKSAAIGWMKFVDNASTANSSCNQRCSGNHSERCGGNLMVRLFNFSLPCSGPLPKPHPSPAPVPKSLPPEHGTIELPPSPKPRSPNEPPLNVSFEPVWFVDDFILDQSTNVTINIHQPSDPYAWHTVLTLEEPWEVGEGCYTDARAVIHDEGKFKLFYDLRGCKDVKHTEPALGFEWSVTCLAESDDGITFRKPILNLVSFRNSSNNNLVALIGNNSLESPNVCMFCSSVFVDPHGGPDGRLKSCAKDHRPGNFLTCVQSGDGLHWRKISAFNIGAIDTQTVVHWDPVTELYNMFTRQWINPPGPKLFPSGGDHTLRSYRCVRRLVGSRTAPYGLPTTLSGWTPLNATHQGSNAGTYEQMNANQSTVLCPDAHDVASFQMPRPRHPQPPLDYYAGTPWIVPGVWNTVLLFGLRNWHWLPIYHPHATPYGVTIGTDSPGGSKEPCMVVSRDRSGSFHWPNEGRESVLGVGPANGISSGTVHVLPLPQLVDDRLYLYFSGDNTDENDEVHPAASLGNARPGENYITSKGQHKSGVGLAITRTAGLSSLDTVGFGGSGEALTRPMRVNGASQLLVNLDQRGRGALWVELQDRHGNVLPGFSLSDGYPIAGINAVNATATWWAGNATTMNIGTAIESVGGVVRLRMWLVATRLFSFKFV